MTTIMSFSYDSRPIQTIVNQIKNVNKRDGIDLQPKYQRGYIWSNEFKDKLIYSIIKSYPIGNISLRVRTNKNDKGAMQEVVDGQQRLTTLYKFISDEHAVQGDVARQIIAYIVDYMEEDSDPKMDRLKRKLGNKGKLSLKYSQLPEAIKENMNAYNISITNIANASDHEITEYFRYLQNQERLRAGEIINSMPESILEVYLQRISDKQLFLKKISYNNERKQFDRVFYSILGLLDNQIGFGVMDKVVLHYASECEGLSDQAHVQANRLLEQINGVTMNEAIPVNYIKANARCMKFFLLLASLGMVDFTTGTRQKLHNLDAINQKLSAFSSAKAESIDTAFYGYSKAVIEEFRLIALISKGGHSYKRVHNRMQILAYYVNDFAHQTAPSGIVPI